MTIFKRRKQPEPVAKPIEPRQRLANLEKARRKRMGQLINPRVSQSDRVRIGRRLASIGEEITALKKVI
jgi:hypothetical protein